jgi:hypothetical protein
MTKTKIDAALAAAEETHAARDPERAEMIKTARLFKSSWLELAEALSRNRRAGAWRRWGFESFEQYAKLELHLRPETVEKLTGSFAFLQKRAPEVLARDGISSPIPSYQAVDFLRRAEESEDATPDVVQALTRKVLADAAPLSAVSREYKDVVFPISDEDRSVRDAATLKAAAARLRDLLPETKAVPKKLANEVAAAVERVLEALEARQPKPHEAA